MQRSQVRQFKVSQSSVFQSTLLGTHSLLLKHNQQDMASLTSRIAHLPADTHPDLSKQPNMLLVFQAIEIQRLTTQIDLLKGKWRQRQDRVINASSYEVQIKELVEKCNFLQNQKYSYREELAQTKDMNDMIYNELAQLKARYEEVDCSAGEKYKLEKARNEELHQQIDKWKSRYASLDRLKAEEAQNNRKAMDSKRQSQLNNSTMDLFSKFENEREQLLFKLREKKQQVNEKELQMQKLANYYEQAQIKLQQQEHNIEGYEEKVALLSQQTYRLNELVRAKNEEIKSLKMNNQHDLSLRISQINVMDETKQKLNLKLKSIEQENYEMRHAIKTSQQNISKLKVKAAEAERLEYQVREARKDSDSKMKALERKDKKIIMLEEEFKKISREMEHKIEGLKQQIEEKVEQLRVVRVKYGNLQKQMVGHMNKVSQRCQQYEHMYTSLQSNYKKILSSSTEVQQRSSQAQLQLKEAALALKQKDHTIYSLQSALKQSELKLRSSDDKYTTVIRDLESQFLRQRRTFQSKLKDNNQNQNRLRQWQNRCHALEEASNEKDVQLHELRANLNRLMVVQEQFGNRQNEMSFELRTFQQRLSRIEEILFNLKGSISQKYRAAEQNAQRLRSAQIKIDGLHQWIQRMSMCLNQPLQQSPRNVSPRGESVSPPRMRPFYSPQLVPTYHSPNHYAQSSSIYTFKQINEAPTMQTQLKDLPVEWLMRWILLCAQVQALRKKVGDKQAKVESLRSSIASKNGSNSTFINNLQMSNTSSQSGFFTTRQNRMERKQKNIYY